MIAIRRTADSFPENEGGIIERPAICAKSSWNGRKDDKVTGDKLGKMRRKALAGHPVTSSVITSLHSAVVGSIFVRTADTRSHGNPPRWACLRHESSSGAMYT